MDSKPHPRIKLNFAVNRGVTLSILQFFSEFKANFLMRSLSKKTQKFQAQYASYISRECHPSFPEAACIMDQQSFQKGLRKDQHIVKVMHVKEGKYFVLVYQDFVIDLIDIDKLAQNQVTQDVQMIAEDMDQQIQDESANKDLVTDPLIVVVRGLPKVDEPKSKLTQKKLIDIVKKKLDIPMYPEHLKLNYVGEGEAKMTTGEAFFTTETVEKARKIAIYFNGYKYNKDHILDSSASPCIKDDLNDSNQVEYQEMEPVSRVQVQDPLSTTLIFCDLYFNEKLESFKIVGIGLNLDYYVIDMNKQQEIKRGEIGEMYGLNYFYMIRGLNYVDDMNPHTILRRMESIAIADHSIADNSDGLTKLKYTAQTDGQYQKSFHLYTELQNDMKNTLGFDLEAVNSSKMGYTQLVIAYQTHQEMVSTVDVIGYNGDPASVKVESSFALQDKAMPICVKQFDVKYLACATINQIEIFDLLSKESVRVIDDLGLSLYGIFRVHSTLLNKQAYYHQAQAQPSLGFECCVGYQQKNLFSFGLKSHADQEVSKEMLEQMAKDGIQEKPLPPRREVLLKLGDVRNFTQVELFDKDTGFYSNWLYYNLKDDEYTFYRVRLTVE